MSVSKRSNTICLSGLLACVGLSVSLQGCLENEEPTSAEPSPTSSASDTSDATPEVPQLEDLSSLRLPTPTKECLLNNVAYQCATISYGSDALQDYELWLPNKAHVSGDRPLVVYTHGGGYWKGDRTDAYNKTSGMQELLDLGYAFATVNYRLSGTVPFELGVTGPHPAEMRDVGTALQDMRMRAADYGYNPNKVALTGVSAGGGISLWLAYHDDLRNPTSPKLRDRYSTRASCVALADTQTTINIAEVTTLLTDKYVLDVGLPGVFGFTPEQYNADPAYYQARYGASMNEASAITHISADDNVNLLLTYMLDYNQGNIHSPEFGDYFTKGTPSDLAAQYGRKSLVSMGKPFVLKVNQQLKNKTNIINHINRCF